MASRSFRLPAPTRTATLLAGTALGIILSLAPNGAAQAQTQAAATMQLAPLSVDADDADDFSYQTKHSSLRKLAAPLLDTPQTVDTVSRRLLDDQGASTLRDALRNVPGISLAAGEFGAQGDNLTIRGFTARNDIYIDGMRDFGSYYRDPFYLDGIEVLKGPSSILFGRGSTGGVVEQSSKSATLDPVTAGTLGFGTDGTKRVTADFDRAISDTAALRINVAGQDSGVAGRDVTENSHLGLAASLALGIGTPTRLTFDYLHQSEYDVPDYGLPWLYTPSGAPTGVARPALLSQTSDNFYGFKEGDYLRTNVDIATARLDHDLNGRVTLSDQFRFGHYVRQFRITEPQTFTTASANTPGGSGTALQLAPGTPLSAITVSRNQLFGTSLETDLDNQADATVKFSTGRIGHTLVGGFELTRETSDPVRDTTIGPYSQTSLLDPNPDQVYNANTYLASRTETTAYSQAVYVLDTLQLSERWQLIAGGRFDRFDARYHQQAFNNPITGTGAAATSFHHIDEMPSWRGALVYKPVPSGTLYVDGGTSFNPSAEALSLSATTANLDPEKSETYEIGSKWEFFRNRLALNGALYHTEKNNVRETDPSNAALNILAGDAVAKGFEFQAAGDLTENWRLSAGYGYTFSAIEKSPTLGVSSDLGHRLANVPMHTATVWTTYRTPWKLQVGGGLNYVSSRFASTTPTKAGSTFYWKEAPGYWTLNAMAKYPLTDKVSLQANLYNLTDAQYYDQLHPSHVVPGPGRSVLFTLAYRD